MTKQRTITLTDRTDELLQEHQFILMRFIQHTASMPYMYQESVMQRLKKFIHENPWIDDIENLDKELFLEAHPTTEEEND
tara:strand:- start:7667 stop:7906 length:240 start_codon:yes stop_codon:yes gene_type:complete